MQTSYLIYGTAWKKERTRGLVLDAWRAGFRAFDAACQPKHYREDLVGEALAHLSSEGVERSSFYLQTKFTPVNGQDARAIPYDAAAPLALQVAESFQVSLRNLRTDYLDALILHSPLDSPDKTLAAWAAMEKIHGAGGARRLGISNCYDLQLLQRLYATAAVKPAVVQNRFYAETGYDREIRRWCLTHDVQYQSFWTLTANPHVLDHRVTRGLAAALHRTPAQIFFRYLHQRGLVPLTGTSDPRHMQEDLAIVDFTLAEDALQEIDRLFE